MRVGQIVAALLLFVSAAAYAQNSKWAEPYEKGVKAFESGKYADAVPLLERAVEAEPKAQGNKTIEGVFRTDYFPYYYLALCYAELKQFDKAKLNLEKARQTLTRQQRGKFGDAETKIAAALTTKPPQRNADFDNGVRDAEALLGSKQYSDAIKRFEQLRTMDSGEYAKAGLAAKRDEAVKAYANQLYDEGRVLVQNAKLNAAKAKFQLADQTLPGQKQVADALGDLKRREETYQNLKAGAQTDVASKNFSSARDKLQQAQTAYPELFAADNLFAALNDVQKNLTTPPGGGRRGTDPRQINTLDKMIADGQAKVRSAKDFISQGKYAEADSAFAAALTADPKNQDAIEAVEKSKKFVALRDQGAQLNKSKSYSAAHQALADARNVDPERFTHEGLGATLEQITAAMGADSSNATLRQGLLALLNGRAQESIAIFEPALSHNGKNASLHAYLGVAYATQSLSAPKPEDRTRLKDKAVEQFRQAAATEPGYRLSERVVSPAIIKIYQQSSAR